MKIFRTTRRPFGEPGAVATIGNFDGVHRGHQAVLQQLRGLADAHAAPAVVVCFEPQPREYFMRPRLIERITPLNEKLHWLEQCGVDGVLLMRFGARLAAEEAEDFIQRRLVEQLAVSAVLVGDDFCFGRARRGDFHLLRATGQRAGFAVVRSETFLDEGGRVSSTRVREALMAGDVDQARRLLGHDYRLSGRVVCGDRIGRTLGFPTANLRTGAFRLPLDGIFTAWVEGLPAQAQPRPALAYVGTRPVVDGSRQVLEVHVLDWSGDCYGRCLRVTFGERLRADEPFAGLEALRVRMQADLRHAREWFARHPLPGLPCTAPA
jgi:riboflavin kinase / FMN adenylyltransferase